ncbi:MAG: L-glutamate gamma-semialdehyde dehydrogenase [Bacillota bacterium]
MATGRFVVTRPDNEPILSYAPGSVERKTLKAELERQMKESVEMPCFIAGEEVRGVETKDAVCPHDHSHVLGRFHVAGPKEVDSAIDAALTAQKDWAQKPWYDRVAVFLRAADLLAGKYRHVLNAATMLGQGKNAFQAEIDSACELIDFLRFNAHFASEIYSEQPASVPGEWNRMDYRPLEGFVFAVTPFNFTAIAGNLPSAPAIMGNTVVWKPASSAVYSAHYIMQILREAGLPPGVINLVYGSGREIGDRVLTHPDLAGVHFTGSTEVFRHMWRTVGENIATYRSYPRLVGETGGKDFVLVHRTADLDATATALSRGAFEYQGQKCSAASRAYVPKSIWPDLWEKLSRQLESMSVGPPTDFSNFINAVIDEKAFESITEYIEFAREASDAEIIFGGDYDDSTGYFIEPTVIVTENPKFKTMCEEIFGPVLTIMPYDGDDYEATLRVADEASPYALTGSVMARDRDAIELALSELRGAAGNFYINDKPTGAVVGRQPFGGARASGTNDKAGSRWNLMRWVSPRTIKENFVPPGDYRYPFMDEA